jgi:hypothetical protein
MEPDDGLGEQIFGEWWPHIKDVFPDQAHDPQTLYEMLSYGNDDQAELAGPTAIAPGQLALF